MGTLSAGRNGRENEQLDQGASSRSGAQGRSSQEEAAQQNAASSQRQRVTGSRGQVTSRPSRESILQSYAAQDAARARDARQYSQAVSQVYQDSSTAARDRAAQRAALVASQREKEVQWAAQRAEAERARREKMQEQMKAQAARNGQAGADSQYRAQRPRTRVVPPLSSQESYDRTRSSVESYERARASRDALSESRRLRTPNREVIDGRGSIDSRAFNENHELVGYSVDARDKPQAAVDASFSDTRWHSRAGQGFEKVPDSGSARPGSIRAASRGDLGFSRGAGSGHGGYPSEKNGILGVISGLPVVVKIGVPLIVLLVVVIVVFFMG